MYLSSKCRVCLSSERRMYAVKNTSIQEIWEKLTNARFNSNDGKPVLACYICCALLRKCHQMMKRALKAEELLTDFINNGLQQSQQIMSSIASHANDLSYNYIFKPLPSSEFNQFQLIAVKEIKKENTEENREGCEETNEDYDEFNREENEVNFDINIKTEEEDYKDPLKEECLDILDTESDKRYDSSPVKSILERAQEREVRIVLEKINADLLTGNHRFEDAPQQTNFKKVNGKIKKFERSHDALDTSLPIENFKACDEIIHTICNVNNQNPEFKLNSENSKPATNVAVQQINHSIENSEEENKILICKVKCENSEADDFEQCSRKNIESPNLFLSLNTIKKEQKLNRFDSLGKELEKNWSCHVCTRKFLRKGDFKKHLYLHTGDKPHECHVCGHKFARKEDFTRHLRIHTGEKPHKCDVCARKFGRKQDFNRHLRIHTGEKPYKCDVCGSKFVRKEDIKKHLRIHTGEKPHKCDVCARKFGRKQDFNRHLRIHTGEKSYKCDVCARKFGRKQDFNRHLLTHTGEKLYKCDVCASKFLRKEDIKKHLCIHTGEEWYKCDLCGHKFARKEDFTRHLLIHTGEKLHKCDVCTRKFGRKQDFNRHLLIHTGEKPYKCDVCARKFVRKGDFNRHLRTHTGEKQYKCDICDFRCIRRSYIEDHIKYKHTKEKQFSCHLCTRKFVQKCNLKVHIRIHTDEQP